MGSNVSPRRRGLRILSLDGGGSRGVVTLESIKQLQRYLGGRQVADCFDIIGGTSTGAIIGFLIGLKRLTTDEAADKYDSLISEIFVKPKFSTIKTAVTTAQYSSLPFQKILLDILGESSMASSRADPSVPLVFAVASKMTSNPTKLCLFRNYAYEDEGSPLTSGRSGRWEGSFRVQQRVALRATTAAPTIFKPVLLRDEFYVDGGVVCSNPAGLALHEAKMLYPHTPVELIVSLGTGKFEEERMKPRMGWDAILGQIVNSATDGEGTHYLLEDLLQSGGADPVSRARDWWRRVRGKMKTRYYRFNPVVGLPNDFGIDETDPDALEELKKITRDFCEEEGVKKQLLEISQILKK